MYKLPPEEKVILGQERWDCPFGTLRLSDHWSVLKYSYGEDEYTSVFNTDVPVPEKTWVLAVNNDGWKVIHIFELNKKNNVVRSLDFNKIKSQIENALCY
jgi:hypothetical protein